MEIHQDVKDDRQAGESETKALLRRAKDAFKRMNTWENNARRNFLNDLKFANGDSYNHWQWPNNIRARREVDDRPSLTINKTRQHNKQIINSSLKRKIGMKFRAAGGGSSGESARIFDAIGRRIEYISRANLAYEHAEKMMVNAGWGYVRLSTRYINDVSWDQDIYIDLVTDPLTVMMDENAKEPDKSDAKYALVFEDVLKEAFKSQYPQYERYAGQNVISDDTGWLRDGYIRIAEWYELSEVEDEMYALPGEAGKPPSIAYRSVLQKAGPGLAEAAKKSAIKERSIWRPQVMYYTIVGDKVIEDETKVWLGKYIPLVPMCADETVIENIMDRVSHTRALLDPQRMYNWWSSLAVEYGSIQTKTPYMAATEAIDGFETMWKDANKVNSAYIPYNAFNEDGEPIPMPKRIEPPMPAPVAIQGMSIAANEMMMVSGQYQANMGQESNERTGRAIDERQEQGDTATIHFGNAKAVCIQQVARNVLDLVPKLYDTKRVLMVLAEDGTEFELEIDPKAAQAYAQRKDHDGKIVQQIFNPMVGEYNVEADSGPAWATKQQESFNALTLILTQAPQLTSIIGDLLIKSGDFYLGDEAAARLRRMVPPQALGEGPSAAEKQATAQIQQLSQLLTKSVEELSKERAKTRDHTAKYRIGLFEAFTKRLQVLLNAKQAQQDHVIDRGELMLAAHQAMQGAMQDAGEEPSDTPADSDEAGGSPGSGGESATKPPFPGAHLGADGHWYARDLSSNTKWRVVS